MTKLKVLSKLGGSMVVAAAKREMLATTKVFLHHESYRPTASNTTSVEAGAPGPTGMTPAFFACTKQPEAAPHGKMSTDGQKTTKVADISD